MKEYLVLKFYGHYCNAYIVNADDEKSAFDNAIYGKPIFSQIMLNSYGEGGIVTGFECESTKENHMKWLIEAMELGMSGTKTQNELVYGLPFVVPGTQEIKRRKYYVY